MSSDALLPALKSELGLVLHSARRRDSMWTLRDGRPFLTVGQLAICRDDAAKRRLCKARLRELEIDPPAWL